MEESLFTDILIVGAGIAGLTTSLGLHRLGIKSLVLESSESLRVTGFAFTTWPNAWRALDALGIGDSLRQQHLWIDGLVVTSAITGQTGAQVSFKANGKRGDLDLYCVRRKLLIEALERELPSGTIRYSSKVVSIEESGYLKVLHLVDGTAIKTKALIGCDGVKSVVAKWLGFKSPEFTSRMAIRGYADFKSSHGFGNKFLQFLGNGMRSGFIACDEKTIYWFFTRWTASQDKELKQDPARMKQLVLNNLGNVPDHVRAIVETTELDSIISSPLRYRYPWDVLWGNISKGSACVAGDALHPMTPDIGQGGCSALEDGIVLARCLAEALTKNPSKETGGEKDKEEHERIEMGLKKYAKERRWRSVDLICTAYMVGLIQQASGSVVKFLRDAMLLNFLTGMLLKKTDFDCGKLVVS